MTFITKLSSAMIVPYKLSRGSVLERQTKAQNLTDEFIQIFLPKVIDKKKLKASTIEHLINTILPEPVKIYIKKNKLDDIANVGTVYSFIFKDMYKYIMNLKMHHYLVKTSNTSAIIHEFRHLADYIYHPKYLAKERDMFRLGLFNDTWDRTYDNFLYKQINISNNNEKKDVLKTIEDTVKKNLEKYNSKEKITTLQNMRYYLQSELNAYNQEYQFIKKTEEKYPQLITEKTNIESFMFEDKIKIIEKILKETIFQERNTF